MGREKDSKGDGKTKDKAKNLKRLSDRERTGAVGDVVKNSTKTSRSKDKTQNAKSPKKVKTLKTETQESVSSSSDSVKREPQDDFTSVNGLKRKRVKDESMEGTSQTAASPTSKRKDKQHSHEEESEGEPLKKKSKVKTEKMVKKEEGEHPVSKKAKRTKEEIEEAKQLKIKKKEEEEQNRWRWWEEEKYEDGVKWKFLEHNGPYFPPEYQPFPDNINFYYNGKKVKLSLAAEEVAVFFAQMLDHEYTTKKVFRENFFKDWRKEMTPEERSLIQDLEKCDFKEIHSMHKAKVEARKNMSKEEKLALKEANQKIVDEHGYCLLDHHKERIGNFKIEPPGLFRGRGEHPKQGMLKKRIQPEDVIINCSNKSRIPVPPAGHHWKEVRCDNTVTWLASWTENIQGSIKYIMLNANSKLKGEKDWEKYEVARKLKSCVEDIRNQYLQDLKSKQMVTRQRAVALYFIDKLALRAGNEKEEGETADTVGCCSLRFEHITLHEQLDGKEFVVEFDFLGKDSIRYYNKVPVIKQVFKNLKLCMENKEPGDDLFDRLNTTLLNKHLSSLMPGLTAKVFRFVFRCKNMEVPIEKIYNKTQRDKFAWAIDMTEADFEF
ncbi:DNA topoisomerase 1 [Nematolebias whitei]|uniref:DNA topoisomerase 1 n=1 Tax=Nematolebias whitei TaxID=451745 RepID=UPI0018997EDB|nr:DNA topoisomerase 1 [Nematolebias whitei]